MLLMYKSLEKIEIVNKHHQSCLCPFNIEIMIKAVIDCKINVNIHRKEFRCRL